MGGQMSLRPFRKIRQAGKGFTLLELLVSASIFLFLLLGAFLLFHQEWRTLRAIHEVRDIRENLEGALQLISRHLKMAGSFPAHTALQAIEPSSVTLYGDLGNSGTLERVSLFLDGTVLRRREDRLEGHSWRRGSGLPVADHITDLIFNYYDRQGLPVSNCAEVAFITVEIAGCGWREDPDLRGGYDLDPSRTGTARIRHLASGVAIKGW
jgi:prepilin-type N-terminal cleavage/methylation domain-containing protein